MKRGDPGFLTRTKVHTLRLTKKVRDVGTSIPHSCIWLSGKPLHALMLLRPSTKLRSREVMCLGNSRQ